MYDHLAHKDLGNTGMPKPTSTCKSSVFESDAEFSECMVTMSKHTTCCVVGMFVCRHGSENLNASPEHALSPIKPKVANKT